MKNILLLVLGIVVTIYGCDKNDEVKPELKLTNLYEIKDNVSDSIQHKVYELYKAYGVPVFFNDTIGKVFVKVDVNGDSIFHYEKLDPAWSYTGYSNLDYDFQYMTDPDEQSRFLTMLEAFLKECGKTLYPYSVLVVNNYSTTDSRDKVTLRSNGDYSVFYKLLIVTGDKNTDLSEKPDEIIRTIIEERITDYKDLLSAFQRVSKEYRGKRDWATLGINELSIPFEFEYYSTFWGRMEVMKVEKFLDAPLYNGASCLEDNWWGFRDYGAEVVELCRKSVRAEIGKFGFVGESIKSMTSAPPRDEEDDLKVFVKEVMRYPKEDFKSIWGGFPLVMQKYEILSGIIIDELGIEL